MKVSERNCHVVERDFPMRQPQLCVIGGGGEGVGRGRGGGILSVPHSSAACERTFSVVRKSCHAAGDNRGPPCNEGETRQLPGF